MKKILLLFMLVISIFTIFKMDSNAEEILTYPFDSIRIVSAFKFDILIDEEPLETSFLYGQVELNEIITVYVGNLEFIFEDQPVQGSGSIMIVTNALGEDIATWLNNSGSSDLETYRSEFYGSWITIDPNVGVIKDFSGDQFSIGYIEDLVIHNYKFVDNLNNEFLMIDGSLIIEEDLDILISAYIEVIEE
ncbi:hypothetical protein [Mariniplasma anaerobium]|uniref:Uncharacterized protein n=1 Tax=Mariniplasma anaerobium TaxID=2735436 RepID=A0A7U9TIN0_9MOLU|nr:hypothetical protein [Mariniplasma anaerobium]BCR35909.1 hypothetical protein MPAN_008020 [Mariniplasma anaerobium]